MSIETIPALRAILGTVLILAVIAAGCTAPTGTQTTPTPTTLPPTTIATTVATPVATTAPPETTVPTTATPNATPTTPPPTTAVPPTPAGVAIPIQNFGFIPQTVTIPVGTTVTWTNLDTVQHQVSNSGSMTVGPGQIFQSQILNKGDTYSFTFTTAGTYQYTCVIHPYMLGIIIVK